VEQQGAQMRTVALWIFEEDFAGEVLPFLAQHFVERFLWKA
jgi:hypothetical protein